MRNIIAGLILLPGLSLAQGLRDGDRPLDEAELAARLGGHVVEFYDSSTASYGADGRYAYRYTPDDPDFTGQFETGPEGRVCVAFDNGFERCDTYVEAGGRLVLITADGLRFPARSVEKLVP